MEKESFNTPCSILNPFLIHDDKQYIRPCWLVDNLHITWNTQFNNLYCEIWVDWHQIYYRQGKDVCSFNFTSRKKFVSEDNSVPPIKNKTIKRKRQDFVSALKRQERLVEGLSIFITVCRLILFVTCNMTNFCHSSTYTSVAQPRGSHLRVYTRIRSKFSKVRISNSPHRRRERLFLIFSLVGRKVAIYLGTEKYEWKSVI